MSLPIYEVQWNDAHGSDGTIFTYEVDHRPYVFTTVGYLVRSDSIGVSIASEVGEDGKIRDCTFIPRAMVIKESPVTIKKASRAKKATPPSPLTPSITPG